MYAFTACLWLKAKEGGIGTPFSYSVPGQPNELVLLQGIHNPVELLINDKVDETICLDKKKNIYVVYPFLCVSFFPTLKMEWLY